MQIQPQLEQALQSLQPDYLEILNESSKHGGYFPGKESHFKVTIVSESFAGLRQVQRHQKIYALVGELLAPEKIHALAIHAYLPSEWQGTRPDSPDCAHAPKG
ncbi:BolA family transcriptional regulator [Acinetobacter qingfengensis]|uniref:BolA family transcriptional regulator n=1 Tax=Acinetobacter qingfengensis TaxID=1262585 RepID=A0A1E7QWD9_9GAMM|nr:BolA family protein [Acinetobacter qingfengensis]KAA8731326.1 BolA family transcriptional regulator [Acinetobacter qingfengensis]OEY91428.1 BolA family transcriptional regulator [Acinetobacter qingfengensis]